MRLLSIFNKPFVVKVLIHLLALGLLIQQYYLAIYDELGADPVEAILHFTGIGALNLLLLTLCLSPLAKKYKQAWLMRLRRLIGLYSFFYALCHLGSFLAFEIQFNASLFLGEIIERPYITIGMLAFVILTLLAITSFNVIQRYMGRHWQRLHNWVYLALALAVFHFYLSVKSDITEPSLYLILGLFLLFLRRKKLFKWLDY